MGSLRNWRRKRQEKWALQHDCHDLCTVASPRLQREGRIEWLREGGGWGKRRVWRPIKDVFHFTLSITSQPTCRADDARREDRVGSVWGACGERVGWFCTGEDGATTRVDQDFIILLFR